MSEPSRIPLGHNLFALVDADDFDRLAAHRWHLKRKKSQPGRYYAQRTVRLGSGRNAPKTGIVLHREVLEDARNEPDYNKVFQAI